MSRNVITNIRIMAVDNCLSKGLAWYAEKAYRHYSQTYHTPLHTTRQLLTPFEAIQIMMENEMDELPIEDLEEIKTKLLDLKDKFYVGDPSGDGSDDGGMSDDEWIAMQDQIVREQEEKNKAKAGKDMKQVSEKIGKAASSLADALKSMQQQVGRDIEAELDKPLTFSPESNKS